MIHRTRPCAFVAFVLPACGLGVPWVALAQSPESDIPEHAAHLEKDESHYAVSSGARDEFLESTAIVDEYDRFSVKFGLALLAGDYTTFNHDDASREQVGVQHDDFEARSVRAMARGHVELFRRRNYQISYDWNGFDNDSATPSLSASDFKVSTDIDGIGTLFCGKTKEAYVYELVGDAANLPQDERFPSPFFKSRNAGLNISDTYADQRGT